MILIWDNMSLCSLWWVFLELESCEEEERREKEAVELELTVSTFPLSLSPSFPSSPALTGIMAALTAPLRDAEVPIFAISTFDTDWLLVKRDLEEKATAALQEDGWTIERD